MESRRLDLLRGARRRQPEDSVRAVARVEDIAVDLRLLAHRFHRSVDGVRRRARVLAWDVVVAVVVAVAVPGGLGESQRALREFRPDRRLDVHEPVLRGGTTEMMRSDSAHARCGPHAVEAVVREDIGGSHPGAVLDEDQPSHRARGLD